MSGVQNRLGGAEVQHRLGGAQVELGAGWAECSTECAGCRLQH